MKILITNAVSLNTGDAAILRGAIGVLRSTFGNDMDVTVYDAKADAAKRYYPEFRYRPALYDQVRSAAKGRWPVKLAAVFVLFLSLVWQRSLGRRLAHRLPQRLRDSLDEYARADLVVATGGTYLVPSYRLFPKIFDFLVTLLLGRPLVLFTQSLGPFPPGRDRLLLRLALRRARLILVRDDASRRHLDDLGVEGDRIAQAADAAFSMARLDLPPRRFPPSGRPLRVAISVRDWPHFQREPPAVGMQRYLSAVAKLTRVLVEDHGVQITFLSTCQGVPEYWTDDSRVADRVVTLLPGAIRRHVTVDREFHRPERLIGVFAEHDMVVATRMHAGILALCAGVPVLPIAYEFKTVELFQRLGLGEITQDIEAVTPESLEQAFRHLLAIGPGLGAQLRSRVEELKSSALGAGPIIRDALAAAAR